MICIKKILFVILLFPILAFAQSVNCTFSVNMQNEIVSQNGVFIVGTMQGWSLSVNPLDDSDGDGIWSTTLSLDTNSYYEFKYVNGVTWADAEVFGGNCIANSGNRFLNTIDYRIFLRRLLKRKYLKQKKEYKKINNKGWEIDFFSNTFLQK